MLYILVVPEVEMRFPCSGCGKEVTPGLTDTYNEGHTTLHGPFANVDEANAWLVEHVGNDFFFLSDSKPGSCVAGRGAGFDLLLGKWGSFIDCRLTALQMFLIESTSEPHPLLRKKV